MSHFTVLVIGDNPEEQLEPYVEQYDEGQRPDFFVFKDVEPEYRKKYESGATPEFYDSSSNSWGLEVSKSFFSAISKLKSNQKTILEYVGGTAFLSSSYVKLGEYYRCYYSADKRTPPKRHIWIKVTRILSSLSTMPDTCTSGSIEVQRVKAPKKVPNKIQYPSFEKFMDEYAGYSSRDEETKQYGYWYNPNAKWDWYQLGGRWAGYMKAKNPMLGVVGNSGAFDNKPTPGYVDSCRKDDIDIEGMKQDIAKEAAEQFDKVWDIVKKYPEGVPTFESVVARYGEKNIQKARDEYNSLPVVVELNKAHLMPFLEDIVDVYYNFDREKYIAQRMKNWLTTFAVLKDGKWYERGEMSWWGVVSNAKDENEWLNQFNKLIEDLPGDTLLSVYDCHI